MKNKQALVILFTANAINGFAQGISMLAIPWYFAQHNQSDDYLLYYLGVTVLSLFWMLYAGVLVDGFNRKDVFLGNNFIQALIILSVASLGYKEGLPAGLIILVFAVTFFGYYIHYPNLYAFAQEITEPKDYGKVITYIEVMGQSAQMASASLAVFLLDGFDMTTEWPLLGEIIVHIPKWEIHDIFLLNAFTYFIAFGMIIFVRYIPVNQTADHHYEEGTLFERLKIGNDYLRNNKLVTIFGMCSFAIFVIALVENFGIRGIYVKQHLQESGAVLSLSEFMYACGSLVSGIIINKLFSKYSIPKSIIILTLLTTFFLFTATISNYSSVFFLFSFVIGFTNAGSRIFRVTYLFKLIPNEMAGRVNSVFNVGNTLLRVFFILLFGAIPIFTEGSNIVFAYGILAMFTLICSIILMAYYKDLVSLTSKVKEREALHTND